MARICLLTAALTGYIALIGVTRAQSVDGNTTTTVNASTAGTSGGSTPAVTTRIVYTTGFVNTTTASTQECVYQKNCGSCVGVTSAKCVWCEKENACKGVLSLGLTDIGSVCKDGLWNANWGLCAVNMMALIIGMSVTAGVLLIALVVCCCCCCCRSGAKQRLQFKREDERLEQDKEQRRQKFADKKAERQAKNDEIRRKYGLMKDETPYQRFDA